MRDGTIVCEPESSVERTGGMAQGKRILISLIAIQGWPCNSRPPSSPAHGGLAQGRMPFLFLNNLRSCFKAHEFHMLHGVFSSHIRANLDALALARLFARGVLAGLFVYHCSFSRQLERAMAVSISGLGRLRAGRDRTRALAGLFSSTPAQERLPDLCGLSGLRCGGLIRSPFLRF